MRIARQGFGPQAYQLEQFFDALPSLAGPSDAMQVERLPHGLQYSSAGIQRCVGILKNDLHFAATLLELAMRDPGNRTAVQYDLAGSRLVEAEHRSPECRLAATGLTDEAECASPPNAQTDVIDCFHMRNDASQ